MVEEPVESVIVPSLSRIDVYPIKSLPGVSVEQARVLPSGALEFDRRWALVDGDDTWVNAKRTPLVHRLQAQFDLENRVVRLADRTVGTWHTFALSSDDPRLAQFISSVLGVNVRLLEEPQRGWPDDTDAPGPTVVSTASLESVANWFPGMTIEQARQRFRANLEIADVTPFWEDRLVGPVGVVVPFNVGPIEFWGVNPCQRCAVPTRDPHSGAVMPSFAKEFAACRAAALTPESPRDRFDHYYRLSVNTRLPPTRLGGTLHRGDKVSVECGMRSAE